jgi:hypothetical protein
MEGLGEGRIPHRVNSEGRHHDNPPHPRIARGWGFFVKNRFESAFGNDLSKDAPNGR